MLQQKEAQEELLQEREKELQSLKGALKEEVETHDQYMAALKEEYESEFQKLLREFELFKEVTALSEDGERKREFLTSGLPSGRATSSWVGRRPGRRRSGSRLIPRPRICSCRGIS